MLPLRALGLPPQLPLPQQIGPDQEQHPHTHIQQGLEHTHASLVDMGRSHPIPVNGLFGLVPPETSARAAAGQPHSAHLAGPSRTNPEKA